MKVGWLVDDPQYIGGAELTQAEFKAAVPEGVEVVDCPVGHVDPTCDRYVLQNCVHYTMDDLSHVAGSPLFKYCHDVYPHSWDAQVKPYVLENASLIFCSPLQRDWMQLEGECIPPPLSLQAFKAPRQSRRHREGTCSIAQWRSPGKGGQYIADYAAANGPMDVYGPGVFTPGGYNVRLKGDVEPEKVAQTLWQYEKFVFLPWSLEPFCRTVAEAHAAGCDVVTNDLVGARYWLTENPEGLENAGERFWDVVLNA